MHSNALPGMAGAPSADDAVRTTSAAAQVAAILRREVQRGDHAPGSRLRQREVADRLGVSTTPVREAFAMLQSEGFLVVHNNRGAVVTRPSEADIEEGYAIRTALEQLAIRRAATDFDAEQLASLRQLLERMQGTEARDKWAALDQEFHHRLNRMAAMPKLLDLIDNLRSGVAYYIESAFEDPEQRAVADREHVDILEACAARDGEAAAELVADHLQHTCTAVTRSLRDRE